MTKRYTCQIKSNQIALLATAPLIRSTGAPISTSTGLQLPNITYDLYVHLLAAILNKQNYPSNQTFYKLKLFLRHRFTKFGKLQTLFLFTLDIDNE